jgi:penicillin-insensitive murein DD-endopeptidase
VDKHQLDGDRVFNEGGELLILVRPDSKALHATTPTPKAAGLAAVGRCTPLTSSLIAVAVALLTVGVFAQTGTSSPHLFAEWAGITAPLPGDPSAIGFYSAGCLQGGEALPLDGAGYAIMRPSRRRFYGHPALVRYLTTLAAGRPGGRGRLLLIGDLGPPRGGPTLSGHASHQNGLAVDIWFITRSTPPTGVARERLSAPGFVIDRKRLRGTWSAARARLLVAAADDGRVNRIFVSPAIKRYMCAQFPRASWLYRLRPWWGHEDHFHVRLRCPADSTLCQEQDALDPGDSGCGADLAWWFSSEADREWSRLRASREPRRFPELPATCAAMPESPTPTPPAGR